MDKLRHLRYVFRVAKEKWAAILYRDSTIFISEVCGEPGNYRQKYRTEIIKGVIIMKKRSAVLSFALFFVLGTYFFSMTASAYIDPSAMTYIVQVIVGIIIAGGAALGYYFKKIKRTIKKGSKTEEKKPVQQASVEKFDNDNEFDDSKLSSEEIDELNGKKRI